MMAATDLRAYLAEYRKQKRRIALLTEELEWQTGVAATGKNICDALGEGDTLTPAATRVAQRLKDEIQKAEERCDGIVELISKIEDVNAKVVMEWHYLNGEQFKGMTGYGESTAKRYHRRGLEELEKYYTAK